VKPEPFRIEPIFVPRIWGARALTPLFPEKTNLPEPVGEVWLTGRECRIDKEPFAGKTLGEVWSAMPADWRGSRLADVSEFPLLVKFIFPKEKLSIQVHPGDSYALTHEKNAGGRGKTEMWHAVSVEPDAQVLVGLKPDANKENFLQGLARHTLEGLFAVHSVHEGDTFFVPAGTPHTIGPGWIVCEVQQYSDLTYRVYDYGRVDAHGKPRELHIDKALDVMNFGKTRGGKTSALPLPSREMKKSLLAACEYFATERYELINPAQLDRDGQHFDLLIILSGSGAIKSQKEMYPYRRGETWLIPASLNAYELAPNDPTILLRTYVPDLASLKNNLRANGFEEAVLSKTVFG